MEDPITLKLATELAANAAAAVGYDALSVWAKITPTHIAYAVCGILITLFAWRLIQKRRKNTIQAA